MISSQGMEKSLSGFKRELFPMFKSWLRRGGAWYSQLSQATFKYSHCQCRQQWPISLSRDVQHCTPQQKEAAYSILDTSYDTQRQSPPNHPTGKLWKAAQVLCVMTGAPSSRAKTFLLAQNTPIFLLGKIPRINFPPLKIFIWNNIPLQRLDIYMNTAI